MRLFIGVDIPEEFEERISYIQSSIKKAKPDIALSMPENLHFTLKFLGEVDVNIAEKLKIKLNECSHFPSFFVHVAGIGSFSNRGNINTIWIGVKDSNKLKELAKMVEKITSELHVNSDNKQFAAHLTIGRVKGGNTRELMKVINELKNEDIGEMKVSEFHLVKSTLTPEGPIYEKIYTVKLLER